mgnify:CR=1 FL=1
MKFLDANWYRILTGTAMLIFSAAFLIYALNLNTVRAGNSEIYNLNDQNFWIVGAGNNIYKVTWDKFSKEYTCTLICNRK